MSPNHIATSNSSSNRKPAPPTETIPIPPATSPRVIPTRTDPISRRGEAPRLAAAAFHTLAENGDFNNGALDLPTSELPPLLSDRLHRSSAMKTFTFVPALALPSGAPRSAWVCGARAVRPAQLPVAARLSFAPRCAAEAPEVAVPEPAAEEVPDVVEIPTEVEVPAEPEIVAEAAPEVEVADDAAKEVVADAAPEVVAGSSTEAAPTKEAPKGERRKRRRRREVEVTLPFDQMTIGMELEGVVKSITSYGAFVGDMGTPTDGLMHVSQLAAGFVENVTDVVQVGSKVKVRVVDIDAVKGNFSLSMKPLPVPGEEPARGGGRGGGRGEARAAAAAKWSAFKFDPKAFIDAKVTSITDFGGFCQLLDAEGNPLENAPTDGLVHISELSESRVNSVSDVLAVGQAVKVRVSSIDKKRNRISLSMKQWAPDETKTLAEDMAAHQSNQPTFKTSFELAFERARKP